MNPFLSWLLLTLLVGAGLTVFFWPRRGLFEKWRRGLASTKRVLMEDALKHLYDQEYNGNICTLQSLSGALSITGDDAARLLHGLQTLELIDARADAFELTSAGRKEALRMVRSHRIWERYLADETGIDQTEWHARAEKLEHTMMADEIEKLAAAIGNPTYDPHGDPIPTASGRIPPKKGQPLTDLEENKFARIVHIEDEPSTVFAQLVAEGLHLGMQIRMLEKSPQRLHFVADGEEVILAPVVAANVTVEEVPKESMLSGPHETLLSLKIGEKGEVTGISPKYRGQQRRRIMDLGVIPGTIISKELRSASGDPTAYNIRGATIALRRSQAEMIQIRRLTEARTNGKS